MMAGSRFGETKRRSMRPLRLSWVLNNGVVGNFAKKGSTRFCDVTRRWIPEFRSVRDSLKSPPRMISFPWACRVAM